MTDLVEAKAQARRAGFDRRKAAHAARPADPSAHLRAALADYPGATVSGYMPIRTEIDPLPAMTQAAQAGVVGIPVIDGKGLPLRFARWVPGMDLVEGPFGAQIPEAPDWIDPDVLIVPLVAFTRGGGRLGYGGGFYDRTLALLRAQRPRRAIGYAYAAQEAPHLPLDPTDQPLDLIVTEAGVIRPG